MRCEKCDHTNPENHKYCGMCGSKLAKVVSSIPIDDNDPLELEAPLYRFEDRSQLAAEEPAQLRERDQRRELVRDAGSRNSRPSERKPASSSAAENLPREVVELEGPRPGPTRNATSTGIGGPSFLGLGYEDAGSSGFVYDKPRNDGFVYDTDGQSPEYLLEETRRGVSWRAWLLLLLLAAGAGLGYIQWRASRHEGPDIATILARNGVTVDPSGPVIPDKSSKRSEPKPSVPNSDASNTDSVNASSEDASLADSDSKVAKSASPDATSDSKDANAQPSDSAAKGKSSDGKSSDGKAAGASAASKTDSNTESGNDSDEAKSASATKDDDEGKPESDGPAAKATKPSHAKPVADEQEPAKPKSLGDKDPLMIQADKYIQGRGVRQNCSAGVNLLRQGVSAGNPAASVKLGALYWSGTCVTQSKVTAYQWFSRAHSLEPQNRWVERSRDSLRASMTPQERRRIGD
ncbi:MAG: hypothetical protein ACJ71Q_11010 [Terriglobales bacterium]